MKWIVSQIGAREHYAAPRAFHKRGRLAHLYTDFWVGPAASLLRSLPRAASALAGRFHPDLPRSKVTAFNFLSAREMWRDWRNRRGMTLTQRYQSFDRIGQNFAEHVNRHLQRHPPDPIQTAAFLFTTGAMETAQYLRTQGIPILLDRLDPARLDEQMVRAEMEKWPGWEELPGQIPESYYQRLAAEWKASDIILVNSNWSRKNLLQEGVDASKIIVVPLCYDAMAQFPQRPPVAGRPLTVLWLGQIVLRKGIPYLFEAARALASTSIRFVVAGRIGVSEKALAAAPPNVQILGRVTTQRARQLFAEADVFVLPTVSDGFALTQLEAMNFGLPVITTPNCGNVVTEGVDGFIVPPADGPALAQAILRLDRDRDLLHSMSVHARQKVKEPQFSLDGYAGAAESAMAEFRAGADARIKAALTA